MSQLARFAGALVGAAALAACSQSAPPPTQPPAPMSPAERGHYLVSTMGCNDCHTPMKMGANGPEPDMTRMLSGHPENVPAARPPRLPDGWMAAANNTFTEWSGPWGISFTANLTPDQNTGLGIWTEDMFVRAMREGKHMGTSRPILPPMPWTALKNLSDDDLKAMFAYLRTIPAISNHVPDPIPPDQIANMK